MARRRRMDAPLSESEARALSERTGWCMNCAREECAQGFCCGHPNNAWRLEAYAKARRERSVSP